MIRALEARLACIRFGFSRTMGEGVVLLFPLITYALLVSVFASIFKVTPFEELGLGSHITADRMIWYIAITELVTMVSGFGFKEVRDTISNGGYGASLHHPVSYGERKLLEWMGRIAFEIFVYLAFAVALGLLWTGMIPFSLWDWPLLIAACFLGCMIKCCLLLTVGLLETWGSYSRAAVWILQKFIFLFGGLILPLALYPEVLQRIAWMLPFPAILTVPAQIVFEPSGETIAIGFVAQFFWLGLCGFLAWAMQERVNTVVMTRGY